MESTSTNSYTSPVNQLLTYGEGKSASPQHWPDYLKLGLGSEQIPDLIRMATDEDLNTGDPDSLEVWAPLHAWRALGQLRAEEAVGPLLSLYDALDNGDWEMSELPEVFAMIGSAALPTLAAYIADVSHSEYARMSGISSVEKIAARMPEARSTCVAILTKQLEQFAENEPDLNGFLILRLVDLQATEVAPVMERAYAAGTVGLVMDDWEDVQVELGMISEEEAEQRRSNILPEKPLSSLTHEMALPRRSSKESSHHREAAHQKAKNKMAKQSRKKNRKR